jgi:hypothetical protein
MVRPNYPPSKLPGNRPFLALMGRRRGEIAWAKYCHKEKYVILILDDRTAAARSHSFGNERVPAEDFCNLSREGAAWKKGTRIFLFESAVTH